MKTIIKKVIEENEPASSYIRRLGDDRAHTLINAGEWSYASKSLWKEKIRDVVKKEEKVKKSKKEKIGDKKSE